MRRVREFFRANALVILMVGLVSFMAAFTLYYSYPDKKWLWLGSLGLGVALWVGLFALHFSDILKYLISQRGKLGANAFVSSFAFLGILILIVYIGDRRNFNWDWTETKRHTLSPQTLKVLRKLDKEVTIIAFYDSNSSDFYRVRDLLKRYEEASPKVTTRVVDPRREPALARQHEVTGTGITIFISGHRKERISFGGEKEFTGAILKVTRAQEPTLYFLQGHGERSPESFDESGYSDLRRGLEALNYRVKTLQLLKRKDIPDDCDVLVIAGAKQDLLPQEKEVIKSYLDKGGRLLLMLEPDPAPSFSDWLDEWGIMTAKGTVVEPANNILNDAAAIFIFSFRFHDITRPFQKAGQEAVLFITARPLKRRDNVPSGITLTELVETTAVSWREEEFRGVVQKDPNEESGPFIMAAAIEKEVVPDGEGEKKPEKMRVVVVADSDFCANAFIRNLRNAAFVANCIHWLAEAVTLIEIPPKDEPPRTLILSRQQQIFTFVWSILALPLVVLITGLFVWWTRRG